MTTRGELFEKYEKLAYKKAQRFMRRYPSLRDDFKSSAIVGLCEGIDKVLEYNHPNPGGLISLLIMQKLWKCLEENICIIRIPVSLIRKERLKAYLEKRDFKISELYPLIIPITVESHRISWREIHETIRDLNFSSIERLIIYKRLEGYNTREIGKYLGFSHNKVAMMIREIKKKWKNGNI